MTLPGKAIYNLGPPCLDHELLWDIVAYAFRLFGFPGMQSLTRSFDPGAGGGLIPDRQVSQNSAAMQATWKAK